MNPVIPEGAQVRVTHLRHFPEHDAYYVTRHEAREWLGTNDPPASKGGSTLVEVLLPDGRGACGIAKCAGMDNFDKRKGRTIATGRALKALAATA